MTRTLRLRPAVLLLAACALHACSGPGSGVDNGTLRVAMTSFSDGTFLPWNGSSPRKLYLDAIYEYLVYIDPETRELMPGLAESWETSADGYTVIVRLRDDAAFHDDHGYVRAEDVEYTFDRVMEPTSVVGISSTLRYMLSEVEALDDETVRFTLNIPDIDFIRGYLSNGSNVPIVSKRYVESVGDEAANRTPVGTGPYRLAEYREDTLIEMRLASPDGQHWRIRPDFDTIRFLSVPEEFTRAAMLRSDEVDIAPINYDSIDPLAAAGVRTMFIPGNWAPVLRFGGLSRQHPDPDVAWQDERVRKAMNYAVDKRAIIEHILHGQALVAPGDFPVDEWRDIEPYPYDPEKARQLLSDAGYGEGLDVTLRTFVTTPGAELPVIASAVATFWSEVGIQTTIVPTTWTSLRTAWYSGNARDVIWTHRGLAFASTIEGLIAGLHSDNLFATFTGDYSDALVERIGQQTDRGERAELIRQLGKYLRDEASSVFIGFANEPIGLSDRVGHWPTLNQQYSYIDRVTRAGTDVAATHTHRLH